MTNITLSIDDETYRKMKKHSEIVWSEYVRKIINQRVNELENLESQRKESIFNMLASEEVLKKDWDNQKDDRWNNV